MGTDEVEHREAVELAERLRGQLTAIRGRARSADGSVTATVGPHGALLELDIRLPVDEVPAGRDVADRVLDAAARAGARAREQSLAAIDRCLPPRLRPLVAADGELDPTALVRGAGGRG